jgi:hypothetical protein
MLNLWRWSGAVMISSAVLVISQPVKAEVIQITNVKTNPTERGLEIILETRSGQVLRDIQSSVRNRISIIDILNTQLNLPNGDDFSQVDNDSGISITVVQSNNNSVRVNIEAPNDFLAVSSEPSESGLVFNVDISGLPGAHPIIGAWRSQDPSLQPYSFIFEPNGTLTIGYQSGGSISTKTREYRVGTQAIDIMMDDNRTLRTIFNITNDGENGGQRLHIELKGVEYDLENRPSIIQEGERIFDRVDERDALTTTSK